MRIRIPIAAVSLLLPLALMAQTGPNPQLRTDIEKLVSDVRVMAQGSTVTQQDLQALRSAVTSLAAGAVKPDPALVKELQATVKAARADQVITKKEKAQIAQEAQAVMASAGVTPSQVQAVMAAAKNIAVKSGFDQQDAAIIRDDLILILNDLPERKKP